MKEYSFPINKAWATGLRPEISVDRNTEALTYSMNAVPRPGGLKRMPILSSAFPSISEDYPFPQVFFFKDVTIVGTRTGLFELQGDGTFLQVISKTVNETWDVLDFGPYIVAVNMGIVWEKDVDTGVYSISSSFPYCVAIENFNGQLIAVGDASSTEVSVARVSWSRIGTADFTIDHRNQAGYTELFGGGSVRDVLMMEGGFVVYTDNSVTWFFSVSSPTYTFGKKTLLDYGVVSKGAACKGSGEHLVVMSNGDLYEISPKGAKYVGYTEFFDSLSSVRITFNPIEGEFYITDGLRTYVYNKGGLGEVGQVITSGGIFDGDFYVMAGSAKEGRYEVVTDVFDMATRGQKTLYAIELSIDSISPVEVAIDWRLNINEGFRRTKWVAAGPSGISTLPVTGVEFRLAIRVLGNGDVNMSSANVRWKLTDKRSIRGQYGG